MTDELPLEAKVLTVSDGVVHGVREDRSGEALAAAVEAAGFAVVEHRVTADGTAPFSRQKPYGCSVKY